MSEINQSHQNHYRGLMIYLSLMRHFPLEQLLLYHIVHYRRALSFTLNFFLFEKEKILLFEMEIFLI